MKTKSAPLAVIASCMLSALLAAGVVLAATGGEQPETLGRKVTPVASVSPATAGTLP